MKRFVKVEEDEFYDYLRAVMDYMRLAEKRDLVTQVYNEHESGFTEDNFIGNVKYAIRKRESTLMIYSYFLPYSVINPLKICAEGLEKE